MPRTSSRVRCADHQPAILNGPCGPHSGPYWETGMSGQTVLSSRIVAVLLVAVAGCSSGSDRVPVFPVRGQVFYQSKPAVGAVVILNPQDASLEGKLPMHPTGKVEADGSFRITTYETHDGAPAGEYKV